MEYVKIPKWLYERLLENIDYLKYYAEITDNDSVDCARVYADIYFIMTNSIDYENYEGYDLWEEHKCLMINKDLDLSEIRRSNGSSSDYYGAFEKEYEQLIATWEDMKNEH